MAGQALLLGATGLIGSHLLQQLLANDIYDSVRLVGRRHPESDDPRVETVTCQLDALDKCAPATFRVDVVFCCLGTTLGKAGSREAFHKVDHDYCVAAATQAKAAGVRHFVMVSAVNANAKGLSYYARVKGETERDVMALGLQRVTFMQPSLLEGERDEMRFAEEMGIKAMGLVKPLLGWTRADWLPVRAEHVATAMWMAANTEGPACQRLRYRDIERLVDDSTAIIKR